MLAELLTKNPVATHVLNELGTGNIQQIGNNLLNTTTGKIAYKFGNGWQVGNNLIRPFANGSIDKNNIRLSQFGSSLLSTTGSIINKFGNSSLISTNGGSLSQFGNGVLLNKKLF